ncbi:phosphoribosylformylglycinamidine cyclo-ligase [Calderihabitans maritimus]
MTYREAGVDIDAGNRAVALIKEHLARTRRPEVLADIGGFGGLFSLDISRYRQPVLVSGTDGVGTKLRIAMLMDKHDTIGIDAVAMCVNDVLVLGAEPLFFLDYLAVGKLKPERVAEIVKGIAAGCEQAGCALIGGETAEMPGFYGEEEYDVAGFAVGVVDRDKIIDGSRIKPGDRLIGLASSGLHSNGFSLARRVLLEAAGLSVDDFVPRLGKTLGEEMLTPTRIYVKPVLELLSRFDIKGMAHITGGGMVENIPRILPEGTEAVLEVSAWPVPEIFKFIQEKGNIEESEMWRTFNMGIGMVLVVPPGQVQEILQYLADRKETAYLIGEIREGNPQVRFI